MVPHMRSSNTGDVWTAWALHGHVKPRRRQERFASAGVVLVRARELQRGRRDASLGPDVRALVVPKKKQDDIFAKAEFLVL